MNKITLIIVIIASAIGLYLFNKYRIAPNIESNDIFVFDQNGNKVSLNDLLEEGTLVNFYVYWCGPCRGEVPELNQLHNESNGISVIGLTDDSPKNFQMLQEKIKFDYPVYRMSGAMKDLGIHTYPTSYLMSEKGLILKKYVDVQDWTSKKFLEEATNKLSE